MTQVLDLWSTLHPAVMAWWSAFLLDVAALRPPPAVAGWLLIAIPFGVLLVGLVIGMVWRKGAYTPLLLVALMVLFGGFGAVSMATPTITAGQPDMRCSDYKHGDAVFLLDAAFVTAIDPLKEMGPKWLVLAVRSPELFGNDLHTCVESMDSPVAKRLLDDKMMKQILTDGYAGGKLSFTMNGKVENPNALLMPPVSPHKGEPDRPLPKYGI